MVLLYLAVGVFPPFPQMFLLFCSVLVHHAILLQHEPRLRIQNKTKVHHRTTRHLKEIVISCYTITPGGALWENGHIGHGRSDILVGLLGRISSTSRRLQQRRLLLSLSFLFKTLGNEEGWRKGLYVWERKKQSFYIKGAPDNRMRDVRVEAPLQTARRLQLAIVPSLSSSILFPSKHTGRFLCDNQRKPPGPWHASYGCSKRVPKSINEPFLDKHGD